MPLNKYKDWQGNDIYTAAREDADGNMITDTKLYAEDAQGNKVPLKVDASGNVLTQITGSIVAVDSAGSVVNDDVSEYRGKSTDTKPTSNVALYSVFLEMDTGDDFYWDGTTWQPGVV